MAGFHGRFRDILWTSLMIAALATVSGCASSAVESPHAMPAPQAASVTVFVLSNGFHSQLVLPSVALSGPLTAFREEFPTARWLAFGWGERSFFMAPHPGIGTALRAMFPAASALLVTGLTHAPTPGAGEQALPLRVSRVGLQGISAYLWSYVKASTQGVPLRLADGPQPDSTFYASTGTYDLFHTCNTWTAAALHAGGLPIRSGGVITAGQLTRRVAQLDPQT
ncbi:MAG TPA: DUF2459 domain-containing protein [Nevskiaceae bacterium]